MIRPSEGPTWDVGRPLTLTVEQAGRALGVGRSTAYELVRADLIRGLQLRRRVVVPAAPLAEQLGVTVEELWRAIEPD